MGCGLFIPLQCDVSRGKGALRAGHCCCHGGRGLCELEGEEDFFGLACFAAERRFQLRG